VVWHRENNNRLSATVRQGRIPEFKYFTNQYDYDKVHEHDININDKILIEKDFEVKDYEENGVHIKQVIDKPSHPHLDRE